MKNRKYAAGQRFIVRLSVFLIALLILVSACSIFFKSVYTVPILMYHNVDNKENESRLSV